MAKKHKFDPQESTATNEVATQQPAPAVEGNGEAPKVSPIGAPRYPTLYLEDNQTGLHYKFDRRSLPKKASVVGNILIDGTPVPFQMTSSKGWAASPEVVIDYLYFSIPQRQIDLVDGIQPEPITGFITLDYAVEAKTFVDRGFTLREGTPNRFPMKADGTGYAERIGKTDTEEKRKQAFKDTMAKKKAEAEAAAAAAPTAETQPAA